MNRSLVLGLGFGLSIMTGTGGLHPARAAQQDAPPLEQPALEAPRTAVVPMLAALDPNADQPVKALTDGSPILSRGGDGEPRASRRGLLTADQFDVVERPHRQAAHVEVGDDDGE